MPCLSRSPLGLIPSGREHPNGSALVLLQGAWQNGARKGRPFAPPTHQVPAPDETETSYDTPEALAEVAARYIAESIEAIEATPPAGQRRPDMLLLKLSVAQTVALFGIAATLAPDDGPWLDSDEAGDGEVGQ